jgi:hypothetical protein
MSDTTVNPEDPDDHTYTVEGARHEEFMLCACGWQPEVLHGLVMDQYNTHLLHVLLDTLGIWHGPGQSEP